MKLLFRFVLLSIFVISTYWINILLPHLQRRTNVPARGYNKSYILNRNNHNVELELDSLPKYQGPGANGELVKKNETDEHYLRVRNKSMIFAANNFISDIIGLKRIQKDMRPDQCKELVYPSNLPAASIIIILREEPIVSLLRTVYSILETSPVKLVREIILVDDGSENLELVFAVKLHAANVDKLKLIRNEKPQGLMMARQKGIENAMSEYFIVLDGHIEVTPGWLEPIIHRLIQEPKALLTSQIGIINQETFEFYNLKFSEIDSAFMFFDQITLNEMWSPYSERFRNIRNGSVLPIEYGMVPGMMMAMRKAFFFSLGGFDPGMEVWGAEHTEMSVKVWLCGGRVEMVPCSKIGHLYRSTPWQKFHPKNQYFIKNQMRFVLVWMDGFLKNVVLDVKKGQGINMDEVGDISERQKIKTLNQCQPYQFYIDKMREISDIYIPTYVRERGFIRNLGTNTCLDHATIDKERLLLSYMCHGHENQYFILTEAFEIRVDISWLTVEPGTKTLRLSRDERITRGLDYKWKYDENGHIIHESSGQCLSIDGNGTVHLDDCSSESLVQRWQWASK